MKDLSKTELQALEPTYSRSGALQLCLAALFENDRVSTTDKFLDENLTYRDLIEALQSGLDAVEEVEEAKNACSADRFIAEVIRSRRAKQN